MSLLPRRILLATDGSEDSGLAARIAADLALRVSSELHVSHAWRPVAPPLITPGAPYAVDYEVYEREGREVLESQVSAIESMGADVRERYLRMGHPVDEILEHHALCPVLVASGEPEAAWPPARVVLADDGSRCATLACELACAIGELFRAAVRLVRVYPRRRETYQEGPLFLTRTVDDRSAGRGALERRATELEKILGSRPEVRPAVGDPAPAILEACEADHGPNLLALGSRGLGILKRMRLGSVSIEVLRAAEGPVLVYPEPEDVRHKA